MESKKDLPQESNEAGPVICTWSRLVRSVLCTNKPERVCNITFCDAEIIANIPQRKLCCK